MKDTIGIDISKPVLDAFRLTTGEHRQFPNDKPGCKALMRWIGQEPVRVVFEPTGPYHRVLEQSLTRAGIAIVKVNPRYARASPKRPASWPRPTGSMRRSWRGWRSFCIWRNVLRAQKSITTSES